RRDDLGRGGEGCEHGPAAELRLADADAGLRELQPRPRPHLRGVRRPRRAARAQPLLQPSWRRRQLRLRRWPRRLPGAIDFVRSLQGTLDPRGRRDDHGRILMMRLLSVLLPLLLAMLLGCATIPAKEPVPVDQVPENLMKVAQKELPEVVKFEQAWKMANGNYEIRGKTKPGKIREIQLKPDGPVVEIE